MQTGNDSSTFPPESSHARKMPPPPYQTVIFLNFFSFHKYAWPWERVKITILFTLVCQCLHTNWYISCPRPAWVLTSQHDTLLTISDSTCATTDTVHKWSLLQLQHDNPWHIFFTHHIPYIILFSHTCHPLANIPAGRTSFNRPQDKSFLSLFVYA